MTDKNLVITPKTKVGELLDNYPQLEPLLIEMAPAFSKLKHPVLRKTIAKVTTLQQAAIVGNIEINQLIVRLREAVGQTGDVINSTDMEYVTDVLPNWFKPEKISKRFDASEIINKGASPMAEILVLAGELKNDEILELTTPFVPAPIIDVLKSKGYSVFCRRTKIVISYISK
jgi:hypothetical protein